MFEIGHLINFLIVSQFKILSHKDTKFTKKNLLWLSVFVGNGDTANFFTGNGS